MKKPVYNICTYARNGEKVRIEAVGLDQEDLSIVKRATSKQLLEKYPHLQGLFLPDGKDGRCVIQLLFGDPLFTRIRTGRSITGKPGEPIADETVFGWTVDRESEANKTPQRRLSRRSFHSKIAMWPIL